MPLFGRSNPGQPTQAELRAAELDLERIRQGGIPRVADERLKPVAGSSTPFFTSDLTAKEYALAQASGLQPLAQVMGSSVVQRGATGGKGAIYSAGEIPPFSKPLNMARERAFDRLRQEAQVCGADGVIGIEFSLRSVGMDRNLEMVVFGTAVRDTQMQQRSDRAGFGMCTLSGQDVDKLRRIGAAVCGVVGYSTVWSVPLDGDSYRAITGTSPFGLPSRANTELTEISEAVSAARGRVLGEIRRQAEEVDANSIVVSTLEHTVQAVSTGYFHVTMNVLATAIRIGAHNPHPSALPTPCLSISLKA